ncbi:hypothetical protein CCS41_14075 (plasmid) [Candidatus Fukatsuia symbiotica]|uniref:Uncharacterized protein n=1 Tax=Candidatus Fukatsuia symbiotica TaxID=1878942 RepID=A0A2U8I8V4_9GAMM|nr:VCBS repeat-containing protein [Candidatus Fukatsuia symbiotica]AWK15547.1 hypothetical protein CCS41_14075 [Candidatus Fukatsuia symbiotica]
MRDNNILNVVHSSPVVQLSPRVRRSAFNAIVSVTGNTMQKYGYSSKARDMSRYDKQRQRCEKKEQAELVFKINLTLWHLISDLLMDAAKYKLTHEMQQSLRTIKSSARFSQLSPIHKSLRVKVAGLGILSTFFDAYKAASAFIALSTTTDAKGRQDLMVKGGLHTAAALIGTGMTVASLIGGTAAAVGGPVGLALVIALYITAEIYVISRQIEVIERYVKDLNIGEKFSIIITTFLGMGLDVSIDNRFRLNQIQEQLEKQRDDQLEKYINKKMISNDAIGTLYVSRRQVTQTRHFYREVVGKGPFGRECILKEDILQETDINLEAIKISHSCPLFILVGKDLINDRHRHDSLEVRNSKRFYSIPGPLLETDDHIDSQVSHRSQHVVAQTFIGAREKVGQFVDEQGISLITDPHFHVNDYYNVMGDFNGDGQRDIGYISMQGAYYLLADGKGGYGDRQKLTVSRKNKPGQPERVEDLKMIFESTVFTLVGNINGDKLDDIVIMDASRGIRILLAQENGHFKEIFQTVTFAALSYKNPAIPVLMDIDQDGHADLVSFTRGTRPSTRKGKIDIHYGTASGTFESGRSQSLASLYKLEKRRTLPEHSSYTHSVTGDINGDGYGDIVLFTETGAIYTLLGRKKDRNNPFEAIPVQLHDGIKNLQSSFKRRQIQLRDINGDGCDDLLVIQNNGSYSLSYGKPEGTFSDETTDERRGGEHYRPNILAVKFQRQILGIGAGTDGKPALLSLNKQGEVNAHPLDPTPTNEIVALFDLGGGSDTVVGHQDQQNSFNVAAGRKHFTGGRYKDRFFLLGQAVPETPSVFKGARDGDDHPQDNADILIADAKPMGGIEDTTSILKRVLSNIFDSPTGQVRQILSLPYTISIMPKDTVKQMIY